MKILMFGRGVIATLYGWALEGAGHTVDFYVRPGRAEVLGSDIRLNIYDLRHPEAIQQIVKKNWNIRLREDLPTDHDYDMIIVSVTHYRFKDVVSFLEKRVANATILILNNFWNDPQVEAASLPQDQLAWGFPAAGGGFQINGELYGAIFPKLEFGTFGTNLSGRETSARDIFSNIGFKYGEHNNFREWLWVHFAISTAVTAEQLRTNMPRREIYKNKNGSMEETVRIVRELMILLKARGINVDDHPELTFFNQPESAVAASLEKMVDGPAFQAAIDGHANPDELKNMYKDVLNESWTLNVSMPLFESAAAFLI